MEGAQSSQTVRGAGSSTGLQNDVARALREAVRVLQDDDLPAAGRRGQLGAADQIAGLLHTDGEEVGADDLHIGVRPDQAGANRHRNRSRGLLPARGRGSRTGAPPRRPAPRWNARSRAGR